MIVLFYFAAANAIALGGWLMWRCYNAGTTFGVPTGFGLLLAGVGFGGDAGRRLTVNRVVDEMLAALDRVD